MSNKIATYKFNYVRVATMVAKMKLIFRQTYANRLWTRLRNFFQGNYWRRGIKHTRIVKNWNLILLYILNGTFLNMQIYLLGFSKTALTILKTMDYRWIIDELSRNDGLSRNQSLSVLSAEKKSFFALRTSWNYCRKRKMCTRTAKIEMKYKNIENCL